MFCPTHSLLPCFPASSLPPSLPSFLPSFLPSPSLSLYLTHSTARARTRETRVTTALPQQSQSKKSVSCALSPMFLLRVLRRVRLPRFGTTYGAARPSSVSSTSAPSVSSVVPSGWRLVAMCCSGDVSQTTGDFAGAFFRDEVARLC